MFGQSRVMLLVGLVAVAIALVAAGCGSVDGDKADSGGTAAAAGGESTGAGAGGETTDGSTSEDSTDGASEETTDGGATAETTDGGESDSGETGGDGVSATSIPKKEYVKKGDAICANVPNEYNQLLGKLPKKQQENKQITVPKAAVPPLRTASEKFAELGSPDGDQAKAEAIVAALEAAADGLEKEPNGELGGPKSSFAEFNKLTQELGFKTCSQL